MDRKTREELNALSKDVFGASSRWQKLVSNGVYELITEEKIEMVPGEKEGDEPTEQKVRVPVKRHDGAHQSVIKRYTLETIKEFMLERKEQLDKIRAELRKRQEEAMAKRAQEQLAKKVHEELQGSAV